MRVLSVSSNYDLSQPEERLVSHSRMTASSCPYRYHKEYLERQKPVFESIELGMGKFFHSYVEGHFKELAASGGTIGASDFIDPDDLVRNFRLSFIWEGRPREPYRICRGNLSITDFTTRLREAGENFNIFLRSNLVGHHVEAVEGALQIRSEDVHIRGKHDLISRSPSGRLVLWDWKTGRKPGAEYWESYRDQKIQIGFYATWMRHKFNATNVEGTAVFLRDGPLHHMTESYRPDVENDVLASATTWRLKINTRTHFPPLPSQLCDWCGWNPTCPAYRRAAVNVSVTPPRYSRPAQTVSTPSVLTQPSSSARSTYRTTAARKSGCFIATCAYGDADAPDVIVLRRFRDDILRRTFEGRIMIRIYEAVGPLAAGIISDHAAARHHLRRFIQGFCVPVVRGKLGQARSRVPFGQPQSGGHALNVERAGGALRHTGDIEVATRLIEPH